MIFESLELRFRCNLKKVESLRVSKNVASPLSLHRRAVVFLSVPSLPLSDLRRIYPSVRLAAVRQSTTLPL